LYRTALLNKPGSIVHNKTAEGWGTGKTSAVLPVFSQASFWLLLSSRMRGKDTRATIVCNNGDIYTTILGSNSHFIHDIDVQAFFLWAHKLALNSDH
jgi:hypothetical protein